MTQNQFSALALIPAPKRTAWQVAWYGKHWTEFSDSDHMQFESHIAGLEYQKQVGYLKYCKNHIGMPQAAYDNFCAAYVKNEDLTD